MAVLAFWRETSLPTLIGFIVKLAVHATIKPKFRRRI